MEINNFDRENIREYGGMFKNMAITFETIQNSLKNILSANTKNKKLMQRLSEDQFIEKPKKSDEDLVLNPHYFSDLFFSISFFQTENLINTGLNFNDVINDTRNENFKMIIGLFNIYSSKDSKTNLKSRDHVAFDIIKSIGEQIRQLISDINKIESAKNKTTDQDIISVFQQFQEINKMISDGKYLFAHKESLLKLVNEYWKIEESQEIKDENDENNEPKKIDESFDTQGNIETNINSNLSSRRTTFSSNLSQETTSSSLNFTYEINAKSGKDQHFESLTHIIKNNAPSMIKDIESLKKQLNQVQGLTSDLDFYAQNMDKRNHYTLWNPLNWYSIWRLRQERKEITKNILDISKRILNSGSSEAKCTQINNLNEKLVDISEENRKSKNETTNRQKDGEQRGVFGKLTSDSMKNGKNFEK